MKNPSFERVLNNLPDVLKDNLGLLKNMTAKINVQAVASTQLYKPIAISYFL